MIEIIESEIQSSELLCGLDDPRAGANLMFLGTTRRWTNEKETVELNYECYATMAQNKLAELRRQAMDRWPLLSCKIVHRIGLVPVGEASLAVVVSSPHRADAFDAAQWLIDTLKQVVPIWKQEVFTDGHRQWVHPGVQAESEVS